MLLLVILLAALAVAEEEPQFTLNRHGLPPPPKAHDRAVPPQWYNISQPLDNFDPKNNKYWNMRYISNPQFWKPGGPIFIMTGAEWTIDPGWLEGGQMFDIAAQNNAWMFYTEHRYYGKSRPTKDLSTANLKYLTTPQALQDVANFITFLRQNVQGLQTAKVVIFGGSYGGNMAIWLREKYPYLVHAAMSSSAPVLAKVDFFEYFEVVQTSLADNACINVIRNGIAATERYLASGADGIKKVQDDYYMCSPLDVKNFYDRALFFNSIANNFAGIVQYASGNDIPNLCNELKTNPQGTDDYTRLAGFVKRRQTGCSGNFKNYVNYYARADLDGDSRQWFFQTCNEYGFFQTSNSTRQPFGHEFPVEMNYKICTDLFGGKYNSAWVNRAVVDTNGYYGGKRPAVTRVISVQGRIDPWHALGLTQDVNPSAPVIVVPGTSHCADLYSISTSDSPAMREAKLREQKLIKQWLEEP